MNDPRWPNNECGCGVEHAKVYLSLDDKIADTDAASLAELAKPYLGQAGKDDGGVHLFEGALVDDFPEPTRRSLSEQRAYIAEKSALNDLTHKSAVFTNAQEIADEVGDVQDFGMPKEAEVEAWKQAQADALSEAQGLVSRAGDDECCPEEEWSSKYAQDDIQELLDKPWIPSEHGIGIHPDIISDIKAEIGIEYEDRASKLNRDEVFIQDADSGGMKAAKMARLDLIDPEFIWMVGEVMGFGLHKYGKDNWKGVKDTDLMIGAALRHIRLHQMQETNDPESGRPHLAHAVCVLMMAWWIREYGDEDVQ